jgi:hypothetical protein
MMTNRLLMSAATLALLAGCNQQPSATTEPTPTPAAAVTSDAAMPAAEPAPMMAADPSANEDVVHAGGVRVTAPEDTSTPEAPGGLAPAPAPSGSETQTDAMPK